MTTLRGFCLIFKTLKKGNSSLFLTDNPHPPDAGSPQEILWQYPRWHINKFQFIRVFTEEISRALVTPHVKEYLENDSKYAQRVIKVRENKTSETGESEINTE